ncbi:MAG: (Fe-S)-binding protein, partial [Deltaproteobacteria bacterium]|nr:(Fe-S)-binding protein [Deltaproteobacteria bacterium]
SYFAHILLILGFLNWLPYGKHFHIITSLPNVFLQKMEPGGALAALNLEDEKAASFGAGKINDFNWKQRLDLYTCTECGRCTAQCPADATGKPLSPKQLSIDLRNHLYDSAPKFNFSWTLPASGKSRSNGKEVSTDLPILLPNIINPETVWACTTCKACEEACPVFIEYIDKIVDMRRHAVLMEGALAPEAQTTLKNIETNSNPWGIGHSTRADWAKGLGIKTLAEDKNVEYLYFVGCAGSFDERAKKVTKAFVKLLQKAGVSFGILGIEEKCNGDSARRIGNEYLFQMLAKENIATFNKYGVKKILTTCPHCFNTIKNEFPQFGGNFEVWHHTEFLLDLIKTDRLSLRAKRSNPVNAGDCFVADAPRNDIA